MGAEFIGMIGKQASLKFIRQNLLRSSAITCVVLSGRTKTPTSTVS